MATTSNIQWTEKTWNPITGCSRVSDGCKNCYAEAMAFRLMHMPHTAERYAGTVRKTKGGKLQFTGRVNVVPEVLDHPRKWKTPQMVFVNSMSDLFHENVPHDYLMQIWRVIKETPQHTYQILTKRPERISESLPADWGDGYSNIWLGVSVENQDQMHRLLTVYAADNILFNEFSQRTNNKFFVSFEPLLDYIELDGFLSPPLNPLVEAKDTFADIYDAIDWVIIGGESGRSYRHCQLDWIERMVATIGTMNDEDHSIAVFVKQLGTHLSKYMGLKDKKGGNMEEWLENLRIREFPV